MIARLATFALSLIIAAPMFAADTPPREPGIAVRLYDIGESMSRIHDLVPGQTPNVNKVVPVLDLRGRRGDFAPLENYFITVASGFLTVDEPGEYRFRLISDDGSKLWINDRLVIDHDGLHGAVPKDGSIELESGEHKLLVHHFENTVDMRLSLYWQLPGTNEFVIVPTSALSVPKGEVRVTSPGRKQIVRPLQPGIPGDGMPLDAVHPSYTMTQARPDWFQPRVGGIDFLSDGRMVVCLWDADGSVYILDNLDAEDHNDISVHRFAAGLAEPLGLCVVDDEIYVLQKQELTRLADTTGDGIADQYEAVCSGWPVTDNFHEFAFGLTYHDGHFYGNLAIAIDPGGASTQPQAPLRGTVLRMSRDGSYEAIAHGLRTPNGIGFGVDGEIFITDNQGDWLPVSKVLHVKEGAFYGSYDVQPKLTGTLQEMPPVVWLPQGEIGNSPGNVASMNDGPYRNQMLHTDITHGGVKRVFAEKIDGQYQGVVFRFTQGLEAGTNRIAWGPDGALYAGGIGSTGNWGQEGKQRYGLQRLIYNGNPTFEMLAIRAKSNGIEVEFTTPLAEGMGWEPDDFYVQQWWYKPTTEYGGPKLDEEELTIKSASVSSDRRRVFLEVDGIKAGHVLYVRLVGPLEDEAGRTPWSTEAWYTMNRVPANRPGAVLDSPLRREHNRLTEAQKRDGWRLLFDGRTTEGWRGFRRSDLPDGWQVVDTTLARVGSGGDIITTDQFENFELKLDWKVEAGGNSGIFWRVSEDHGAVWVTGPEMQILDNTRHADGGNPMTSAGADYAMYAPSRDVTRPVGRFNTARIRVQGNCVTYWLNGVKIVEYELFSDDWNARYAASKFSGMPHFARMPKGHIALQDHGDPVQFRNIMIRELPAD